MTPDPVAAEQFPELNSPDDPMREGDEMDEARSDVGGIPTGDAARIPSDLERETPPAAAPAAAPPRTAYTDMQRRIGKLFAQKKSAEEAISAERQRAEALETKVRELEARMEASRFQPAAAPAIAAEFNPYAPAGPAKTGGFDPRAISEVVERALNPFVQRLNAQESRSALAAAHEQSWAVAAEEWPEIDQQNSELHRVALQLLRDDPELGGSANGPYKAVALARGFLADSRQQAARAEVSRRIVGTPATTSVPGDGRTLAAVQKEYDDLMRVGVRDYQGYARATELRNQIRALKSRR